MLILILLIFNPLRRDSPCSNRKRAYQPHWIGLVSRTVHLQRWLLPTAKDCFNMLSYRERDVLAPGTSHNLNTDGQDRLLSYQRGQLLPASR